MTAKKSVTEKITIKQQIINHLEKGYCICHGHADKLTGSQSGNRRLREIIEENPGKYGYYMIPSKHGGYYKVFCKIIGRLSSIQLCATGWYVRCSINLLGRVNSKMFTTKKEAEKLFKRCNQQETK